MAIRYGNVGAGALIGGLAKGAGEAIAAQRATELAQRIAEQQQEQKARREEIMIQLQAQKDMKMIDYQMELEKYQRSKEWDIEKMEAASRIDFEKEEKTKAAKESEYQLKKKAILDSSVLTKQQKDKLAVALDMEYLGAGGLAQQFMKPKTMEEIAVERAEEARQGTAGATGTTEGVGIGNKELAVIGKDLIAFDMDKGTQVPIEDTKLYSVTRTDGKTGNVTGAELKRGWDTDVIKFHGEAVTSQPAHPKAQEEMQSKFGGTGGGIIKHEYKEAAAFVDPADITVNPSYTQSEYTRATSAINTQEKRESIITESELNKTLFPSMTEPKTLSIEETNELLEVFNKYGIVFDTEPKYRNFVESLNTAGLKPVAEANPMSFGRPAKVQDRELSQEEIEQKIDQIISNLEKRGIIPDKTMEKIKASIYKLFKIDMDYLSKPTSSLNTNGLKRVTPRYGQSFSKAD